MRFGSMHPYLTIGSPVPRSKLRGPLRLDIKLKAFVKSRNCKSHLSALSKVVFMG